MRISGLNLGSVKPAKPVDAGTYKLEVVKVGEIKVSQSEKMKGIGYCPVTFKIPTHPDSKPITECFWFPNEQNEETMRHFRRLQQFIFSIGLDGMADEVDTDSWTGRTCDAVVTLVTEDNGEPGNKISRFVTSAI